MGRAVAATRVLFRGSLDGATMFTVRVPIEEGLREVWHEVARDPMSETPQETARDTWNIREGSVEMWVSMVGDPRDCPPAQPASVGAEASTGKLGGQGQGERCSVSFPRGLEGSKFRGQTWIHRPARE